MGLGVWDSGFGVWGFGFGVSGCGSGYGVWGLGFSFWGLGFGVQGLGCGVQGVGRVVGRAIRLVHEELENPVGRGVLGALYLSITDGGRLYSHASTRIKTLPERSQESAFLHVHRNDHSI